MSSTNEVFQKNDDTLLIPTVKRKSHKKIRYYNIMLVGEDSIGKKTFISSVFDQKNMFNLPLQEEEIIGNFNDDASPMNIPINIESNCYEIDINSQKFRLKIINTKRFGDSIDLTNTYTPIIQFIDYQLGEFLKDETSVERRNIVDNRVHCLLFFINPNRTRLNPFEIIFLQTVQSRVNIIPVIAKTDILTKEDIDLRKHNIKTQLVEHSICIYPFPDESFYEEFDDLAKFSVLLKKSVPFAVCSSLNKVSVPNSQSKVYARVYPWGVFNIEDSKLCDFNMAKKMLTQTHVDDFIDTTGDIFYENYRTNRLKGEPSTRPSLGAIPSYHDVI